MEMADRKGPAYLDFCGSRCFSGPDELRLEKCLEGGSGGRYAAFSCQGGSSTVMMLPWWSW